MGISVSFVRGWDSSSFNQISSFRLLSESSKKDVEPEFPTFEDCSFKPAPPMLILSTRFALCGSKMPGTINS